MVFYQNLFSCTRLVRKIKFQTFKDGGTDYTVVRIIRTRMDQNAVSKANGEIDMYQVLV